MFEPGQRRRRVENQTGLAALVPYQREGAINVPARLRVKRNVRRARLREIGDDAIDRFDHQVNVDRCFDAVVAQRVANKRPDRQVRHEMVVHDVEMHDLRAGIEHGFDVFTQPREVSR